MRKRWRRSARIVTMLVLGGQAEEKALRAILPADLRLGPSGRRCGRVRGGSGKSLGTGDGVPLERGRARGTRLLRIESRIGGGGGGGGESSWPNMS